MGDKEARLVDLVAEMMGQVLAQKRSARASGEYKVNMEFHEGQLARVHVDEHTILKPSDLKEQ